jgi:multidrug efflux system membrane fusion protein
MPEHIMPAPTHGGEPPRPPESKKRSSGKGWIWLLVLIAAAAAAYYYWPKGNATEAGTAPSGGGTGKKKGGGLPPVVAVKAQAGNIGVYIDGPGNVIPIYTVTVKSRVDGQLMQIYYKEGDVVQKDQPLIELDPRPYQVALEQAEGQLARDQALLANARVDQTRYQTLYAQNAVPEQTLATQKSLVDQLAGTIQTDQGMIDSAKLNITYCHIAAPITGKIGLRLVDPGNIVHATDANGLVVITQMDPISVIFTISEDQLPPISRKFRAGEKLTVEAWDRDKTHRLSTGYLATLDNQIDNTTGTLKLRAQYDNKDYSLYPNQFVNARLLQEEKRNVTLLPTAAIQRTTSSVYVWLLKPDSTVTVRNITVGTTEGQQSEITSGLAPGDSVIMTGVDKLNEGSRVNFASGGAAGGQPGAAPAADAQQGKGGRRGGKSGGKGQ